ncbi:MAG TPA: mycothiol synthase [Acidimicrobiales bacterium]|nr:mycothiol synthase [Acidimicrobiales bacterium]
MAGSARRVVSSPSPADDDQAAADGLTEIRNVLQLRRPLPMEATNRVPTRAFVPGSGDEAKWIEVNNRAFATHPDQSNMTPERLHADLSADWFHPEGFRMHERDGRLAAFCWTKRHRATSTDPAMGEIYVIGVDPDFQGLGLGRSLVIAGLAWLADAGETIGMLYVDETNTPAARLYDQLGFSLHHVDRVYDAPGPGSSDEAQPTQ